ncbi:MAG: pyridoxine 5-phosphate synthase [Blastocatellia bacterium]|jgi:hypothetical protein|nr:pyridoxine 5-phosphate synthase [Blastocatellia bacterium]
MFIVYERRCRTAELTRRREFIQASPDESSYETGFRRSRPTICYPARSISASRLRIGRVEVNPTFEFATAGDTVLILPGPPEIDPYARVFFKVGSRNTEKERTSCAKRYERTSMAAVADFVFVGLNIFYVIEKTTVAIFFRRPAVRANQELRRLREGAALAAQYGLHVAAGHGLTVRNVGAVAEISEVEEFNIGHSIISQAVFVGLENSVRAMREAIAAAAQ